MIDKGLSEATGAWCVRRKVRVPSLVHPADGAKVEHALADVEGVLRVSADCDKRSVALDYLVTQTDFRTLERALETLGFPPASGRWARFRSGWYQNLDLTGRENAGAAPSACCNKPPTHGPR